MFSKLISKSFSKATTILPSRAFSVIPQISAKEVPVLGTVFDQKSERYSAQKKLNDTLLAEFNSLLEKTSQGGGVKIQQKLRQQNKLPVRERIDKLLDLGSPFLELSQLAGHELYGEEEVAAGGLVTGIGLIHGRFCMVVANDPSVRGGNYYPITVKKHLRAQEIARENNLPCVYLTDPGNVDLPRQDEVFPDKDHFGRILHNQGLMSAERIPQISVVLGTCSGSAAYIPAMSDENVIVKGNGKVFIGGPSLVRAVTGGSVTAEELGGADITCRVSGLTDHFAADETEALLIARDIVANLNLKSSNFAKGTYDEPIYDQEDLNYLIDADLKEFVEARDIISRIVDGSRFAEFKKTYGYSLVTGFGSLYGHEVGIIANNGVLQGEATLKGAHFVELCSQRNIPLIFLHNTSGFNVGKKVEHDGLLKQNAKMLQAVTSSQVPKLSVIVGRSYGSGHYNMCGRSSSPRFLYSWPTAKVGLVGSEQAAFALAQVEKEKVLKSGLTLNVAQENQILEKIKAQTEKQTSYAYGSARLWDDGVILPSDTRKVLGLSLMVSLNKEIPQSNHGVFRM